jgi:hypothetical protein
MRVGRNRHLKLGLEALRAAQLLLVHVSEPETCIMKTYLLITSGLLLAALSSAPLPADAKTMKECAAQWQEMKAANQTAGMKYRDFTKQCMSGEAAPGAGTAPAAGTTPAATPAPAPAATAPAAETAPSAAPAKKPSPGREAMIARERACGAEWKADKAAGKIEAGMKWPQYWSACNKRKKAEGM